MPDYRACPWCAGPHEPNSLTQTAELAALEEVVAAYQQDRAEWLAEFGPDAPYPHVDTLANLEDAAEDKRAVQPAACKFCGLSPCLCATPEEIQAAGLVEVELW